MAQDLKITLVGGATAILELGGVRCLTDPTFDPPGTYQGGVTLTKTAGPALSAPEVGGVDAVLLSHDQHWDNLDRGGRAFLSAAQVVFTTPSGAQRLQANAKGLAAWQTAEITGISGKTLHVTATPARHGPAGIEPISGDVTGFVLSSSAGEPLVYVTGDTVWHEGTVEVARRYPVKVVLAFAGGAQARGPFFLTMNTNDAVEAAHYFPDAVIVPVHHQGWQHFTQSQADIAKTFQALGIKRRLRTIEPGQQLTLSL